MGLPQWLHGAVTADGGEVRPCSRRFGFCRSLFRGRAPWQIALSKIPRGPCREIPDCCRAGSLLSSGTGASAECAEARATGWRIAVLSFVIAAAGRSARRNWRITARSCFRASPPRPTGFRGGRARAARQDRAFVGDEQRRGCDRTRAGGRRARVRARLYGLPALNANADANIGATSELAEKARLPPEPQARTGGV